MGWQLMRLKSPTAASAPAFYFDPESMLPAKKKEKKEEHVVGRTYTYKEVFAEEIAAKAKLAAKKKEKEVFVGSMLITAFPMLPVTTAKNSITDCNNESGEDSGNDEGVEAARSQELLFL